jgi:hypothetical protein
MFTKRCSYSEKAYGGEDRLRVVSIYSALRGWPDPVHAPVTESPKPWAGSCWEGEILPFFLVRNTVNNLLSSFIPTPVSYLCFMENQVKRCLWNQSNTLQTRRTIYVPAPTRRLNTWEESTTWWWLGSPKAMASRDSEMKGCALDRKECKNCVW